MSHLIQVFKYWVVFAGLLILTLGCSPGVSTPTSPSSNRTGDIGPTVSSLIAVSQDVVVQGDKVNLIVLLSGTPPDLYDTARETADSAFPQIRILSEQIKQIYRANRDKEATVSVQSEVTPLVNQVLGLKKQRASYVSSLLHQGLDGIQLEAVKAIAAVPNTRVASADIVLNSLAVETSRDHMMQIGSLPQVSKVVEDMPLAPLTDTTAQALKLRPPAYPQVVWDKGFHGEGVSVMALDTGVYAAHDAFVGLDLKSEKFPKSTSGCTTDDDANHGTHSCGVIASQDATYKGLAYGIDTYYNAKMCNGADGFAAIQQAYDWAALGGSGYDDASVLNFSMVFAFQCDERDGLDMISEFVDNTIDLYDVVWSLGAGNRSAGCKADQLNDKPAVGYNGVAVAGVLDQNTGLRDDDEYFTDSKYGPCYGADGTEERLKPDIMGNTGATSPAAGGGFGDFGGTSCAAPHYSGVTAVLMSAGVTNSLELRALTFATAEDFMKDPCTPGPDYYSGFGYPDAWAAYSHIADTYSGKFFKTGDTSTYRIQKVHAGDRVVLVYNKHKAVGSYKLSNLDLKVTDKASGAVLYETTKVFENKEYIQFGAADEGKDVLITVEATKIATGLSSEPWAISSSAFMNEYSVPDAKAPVIVAPVSGYNYTLGENLTFSWAPAPSTLPSGYWVDIWIDGKHFQLLPDGGLYLGLSKQLSLPFTFVETKAHDGIWQWSVASVIGGKKYWSEKAYLYKLTAPTLISPLHNGKVLALDTFDWNDTPGSLNYVAQITGLKPGDVPIYLPLNSTESQFVLSQKLFDLLPSDKTCTWAIAATALGSTLSGKDQLTLSKLAYSVPWNFSK